MTIRITWGRAVAAFVTLALAGLLFAWSGIFNIAASSGHWPVTDWFLHWAMRNSVRTHAAFSVPKDAADPTGMVSAAGHFDASCAICHGAPGRRPSPVMQAATPPAPDLAVNAREWSDRQIFWILRHGVKYTGMPAWPALDRTDEIGRMTAFVRALPTMTQARYETLVGRATMTAARADPIAACVGCHGADGRGRGQRDIPVIAGQNAAYLHATLRAYATGRRASGVMAQAAAPLDDATMRRLADRFAAMPASGPSRPATPDAAAVRIIADGLPDRQLPACASCHAPGRSPLYPKLAGQRAGYIAARLRGWQAEEGTPDARLPQDAMPAIARRIPEDMIDPLARTLAAGMR
ncbi:c-type cytochrome [Sphingomonas solaris]|uniref:Cytochrome C n=1 Tax=Alterirhizorhabdus solaris TaxID=2529389 RepID=A0A558R7K7_9SPHN|nr:c-type cytochrome [Sphingomonas solaris]TVV75370.1 cytochrome C [Sphingomonas solaris]